MVLEREANRVRWEAWGAPRGGLSEAPDVRGGARCSEIRERRFRQRQLLGFKEKEALTGMLPPV